jgi:hypothetical protein
MFCLMFRILHSGMCCEGFVAVPGDSGGEAGVPVGTSLS